MDIAHNILVAPLYLVVALAVALAMWYWFGNRAGILAMLTMIGLGALRQYRENALLRERVKREKADRDAISKSNEVRRQSRTDSMSGKLRDDDGFRRK